MVKNFNQNQNLTFDSKLDLDSKSKIWPQFDNFWIWPQIEIKWKFALWIKIWPQKQSWPPIKNLTSKFQSQIKIWPQNQISLPDLKLDLKLISPNLKFSLRIKIRPQRQSWPPIKNLTSATKFEHKSKIWPEFWPQRQVWTRNQDLTSKTELTNKIKFIRNFKTSPEPSIVVEAVLLYSQRTFGTLLYVQNI